MGDYAARVCPELGTKISRFAVSMSLKLHFPANIWISICANCRELERFLATDFTENAQRTQRNTKNFKSYEESAFSNVLISSCFSVSSMRSP